MHGDTVGTNRPTGGLIASRRFTAVVAATVVVFVLVITRLDRSRREREVEASVRHVPADTSQAPRGERSRTIGTPRQAFGDQAGANAGDWREIQRLRTEIADLQRRAMTRRAEIVAASAQRIADASRAPEGRDPMQAPTKLEYFRNVGRDTPANALQTLVWAALHGDEETVTSGLSLDDRAAQRAEALIEKLPQEIRRDYTPEKLAALWFEQSVLDTPAAQIVREEPQDATHTAVIVSGGIADSGTLDFQHGQNGWSLVVPQHGLEVIQKKVFGSSPPLPR